MLRIRVWQRSLLPSLTGTFNFQLYKSGETDQGVIGLVKDGKPTSAYSLNFTEPGRKTITIEVADPNDLDFALEGWIDV